MLIRGWICIPYFAQDSYTSTTVKQDRWNLCNKNEPLSR